MTAKKCIVLTGGGSAGHVTPNLALIPRLIELGYELHYIGTENGIERTIVEPVLNQIEGQGNFNYHFIRAGKLRRYLSFKNLSDVFRVVYGCFQSALILNRLKPGLVFAKGGFVSVPVIIGAWLNRIPAIIHESDLTPGLANRLSLPFVSKVCYSFAETAKHLPKDKRIWTGTPVRPELFSGKAEEGRKLCGFDHSRPVLMVMGGSLGSKVINDVVREALPDLSNQFQICHICGQGNIEPSLAETEGYKQFEYVEQDLADLFSMADIVVSRAGANALFELAALQKPNLLIPLSKKVSRGDQILNARSFVGQGYSRMIQEEDLTTGALIAGLREVYNRREVIRAAMSVGRFRNGIEAILKTIAELNPALGSNHK